MQELRRPQQECLEAIDKHFDAENSRALIKMFCGVGKSRIIYNTLLKHGGNLAVVVVPSINLITQFNTDYLIKYAEHSETDYKTLTICSKDEIGAKGVEFTTDPDEILEFLESDGDEQKIVLITYQSLETLFTIIEENDMTIDLICFDEAHHVTAEGTQELLFGPPTYDDSDERYGFIDTNIERSLFFTATPINKYDICMFNLDNHITIGEVDYEFQDTLEANECSSEEPHCGDMIYNYTHRDGVNDGILNDFNILVMLMLSVFNVDPMYSLFETISRAILKTGNSRVLTFHCRVNETDSTRGISVLSFYSEANKKLFKKVFNKIVELEFPEKKDYYKDITLTGMTGSTKNRIEILKALDSTPDNKIYLLGSCETIGEGVDTKKANMCVFVDPKQSYVKIIQNIGRICRKQENGRKSTVLIPAYVNAEKYKGCGNDPVARDKVIREEMSKTGDYRGIMNCLSAVRQDDPYMFELCLNYPNVFTKKELKDNYRRDGLMLDETEYSGLELFKSIGLVEYNPKVTEKGNFNMLSNKLRTNIQISNQKILEDEMYIDKGFEKTTHFVKTEDDKYMKVLEDKKHTEKREKRIEKPTRNIKPFVHANPDVQVLWGFTSDLDVGKSVFGGYIEATVVVDNEEKWHGNLKALMNHIDVHGKRPSDKDKDETIKTLGGWTNRQVTNYKESKNIMTNPEIRQVWESFITNPKYSKYFISNIEGWHGNLKALMNHIDVHGERPSDKDKDPTIKSIGYWTSNQVTNYKESKQIMTNPEIRQAWESFITNPKYSKYFISNIEEWHSNLKALMNHIDVHGERPNKRDKDPTIKSLGIWKIKQVTNYKKYKKIMTNPEIRQAWESFITNPKYSKYFISNIEEWHGNLKALMNHIDVHGERPKQRDKDPTIKSLGNWTSNQVTNYNKYKENKESINIMTNPEIRQAWESFITNPKYSKYFTKESKPAPKSTTVKPKIKIIDEPKETEVQRQQRQQSEYQELTKKMSTQKSETTNQMFTTTPSLWHSYHDSRDFSFKGYDNQDEIPLNKIIKYLETKKSHKLNILDLGCGRNLIQEHFKDNKKFTVTGYDYVSYNGSKVADISQLPEGDESVKVCVYSQALMGSNWKEYLVEGYRVLEYNGEMIISESVERYDIVKEQLAAIGMHIIREEYAETNRWFYIYAIKQ